VSTDILVGVGQEFRPGAQAGLMAWWFRLDRTLQTMNKPKRSVAKELLIFSGCFILGMVIIPEFIITFLDPDTAYREVLDSFFVHPQLGAWSIAASPYIFYLLIQAIL
jgi:hypothetical protein